MSRPNVYERFLCGSEANMEPSAPILEMTNSQKKILSTILASICHSREYSSLLPSVASVSACCVDVARDRLLVTTDGLHRRVDDVHPRRLFCRTMTPVVLFCCSSSLRIDRLSRSSVSRYLAGTESWFLAAVVGVMTAGTADDVTDSRCDDRPRRRCRKTRLTDDGTRLPESLRRKMLVTMTAMTSATDTISIVRLNRIPASAEDMR